MSSSPTISIKGLSVGYQRRLFSIPELEIEQGEVISVIGPNGIGKSTFLRTIGGLLEPLTGSVHIKGRDLNTLTRQEIAKRIAFVFTDKPDNGLKVEEVVTLGRFPWAGILGRLGQSDRDIILSAMSRTDVLRFRDREMRRLSDGERQKVMIARALAQNGSLLLLDEPTAFLDAGNKVRIISLLKKIAHEKNKSVILTTHDIQLAIDHSDRILVIHPMGHWIGIPAELGPSGMLDVAFGTDLMSIDERGNLRFS